jgi:chloramphenicol-sensitive protein RarD
VYAVGAYGLWGVFPLYFKAIKSVPPLEVLAHRIFWSLLFLLVLMAWRGGLRATRAALRSPRALAYLSVTTLLIASNWLVFIWAVANNHVLEASLGYFINPLVNVLLGFVFLRERLRPVQTVSVLLAAAAVTYMAAGAGNFPAVALFLAGTFGAYGLLRKIAPVEALVGLTVETGLLTPLALGYLVVQLARGEAMFGGQSTALNILLPLAGVVTATPLLWFAQAARRLRLATMGFLQYLAPTGHFLLAVLAFGEPFTAQHLITFGCIWTALALYSVDAWRSRPAVVPAPE